MINHSISKPFLNLFSVVLSGIAVILGVAHLPGERTQIAQTDSVPRTVQINVEETPTPRIPPTVSSYAPAVKRAAPSVVNVYSTHTSRESGSLLDNPLLRRFFGGHLPRQSDDSETPLHKSESLGSGVIVSADGYILTNFHVVDDADEIKVALADGHTEFSAKIIGSDPQSDVAVIKIQATNLPIITMGNSDSLQVGDVVLAVGNPFGVGQTVTMGIASAVGRGGFGVEDIEDFIQTDASINPGNSGGALIDVNGCLVGLNAAILSRTGGNQGIGFAIPVNLARNVLEQILKSGRVMRGYLGVLTQPLTPELARAFKLPGTQNGALVGDVSSNSPAARAGLKEGDVITGYNGRSIRDSRDLSLLIAKSSPHTNVNLQVLRAGKTQQLSATLAEAPRNNPAESDTKLVQREESAKGDASNQSSLDSVEVTDLNSDMRDMLEIPSAIHGALVARIDPDSPSYDAGLRTGDVITDINGKPVKNADSAVQTGHQSRGASALLRVWTKEGRHYVAVENQFAGR